MLDFCGPMEYILIDTHTHLYLENFATDLDEIIARAEQKNVRKFYLPAIDSETHRAMIELESRFPGRCISMMGLHPCSVKDNYKDELNIVLQWLEQREFVAIGEIGLDYYWDKTHVAQQKESFRIQMEWALERSIPIVIHSRDSMDDSIDEVVPFAKRGLRGIFHCFSGNADQAKRIIDSGFYLGIGGVLTYKKSGLAEALSDISIESMVLETDSPFLTPVPFRGKRNESSYLLYVAEKLAEIKGISVEEVARITSANAENIFGN